MKKSRSPCSGGGSGALTTDEELGAPRTAGDAGTNGSEFLVEAVPSCPACGGEVAEVVHSSMALYWPHH